MQHPFHTTKIEDLAFYLSGFLLQHYPQLLVDGYKLDAIPGSDVDFLAAKQEKEKKKNNDRKNTKH